MTCDPPRCDFWKRRPSLALSTCCSGPMRPSAGWKGKKPKFPEAEREYLLRAIRYVDGVSLRLRPGGAGQLCRCPKVFGRQRGWSMRRAITRPSGPFAAPTVCNIASCGRQDLRGLPDGLPEPPAASGRKRVLVTGCFDWFHSGHVRFFEEVSELGDLYVVVGHDANIKLLKGDGHPLFPEQRAALSGPVGPLRQAGAGLHGPRLAGRRAGNP